MDMGGFTRQGGPQIVDRFGRALSGIQSGFRSVTYLTASAGNDRVRLGAIPVRGSVTIRVNGSPGVYTQQSPTVYAFSPALAASDAVVVEYMSTTNVRAATTIYTATSGGASILAKLSAWWDLSEASGTRADSHASFDMTPDSGAVSTADGPRGSGDTCVSVSAYGGLLATSASGDALDSAASNCVFGWFRANTTHSGYVVGRWNGSYSGVLGYSVYVWSDGTMGAQFGGADYNEAVISSYSASTWYFFTAWRDSADGYVRFEVNASGSPAVSSVTYGPSTPTAIDVCIGRTATSKTYYPFNGRLSRIGYIKGSFLTLAERTWLYNSGAGRDYSEL